MNSLFLCSVVLFCLPSPQAKKVDGYLINPTGDTVKCQIRLDNLELFTKVVAYDSAGKSTAYRPGKHELLGFGFVYKDEKYDYVLKQHEDSSWDFLIRMQQGKRFTLYYSFEWISTGTAGSYRSDSYMLEDANKRLVTVRGNLLSRWKKKIEKYLEADGALLALFDEKAKKITDIPLFVAAANDLN